jgi:hypothetical protein
MIRVPVANNPPCCALATASYEHVGASDELLLCVSHLNESCDHERLVVPSSTNCRRDRDMNKIVASVGCCPFMRLRDESSRGKEHAWGLF